MNRHRVAIVQYRKKIESLRKAVELSGTFENLTGNEKVFLKPNIVYWVIDPSYSKYGIITTSRIVEDTIILLKERGISDITIGEGIITYKPNDFKAAHHAFETLGYNKFKDRYGVKVINVFERPFEKVDIGDGITLNFNVDFLHSDFIVSLPVLKTHSQTKVSLAIKNLKGLIDVKSRKKCHSADTDKDLDFYISRFPNNLPPTVAIVDGIYTNERGPGFDGKMRRSNILVASSDFFSADKVGAKILGFDPSEVSYLVHYAKDNNRPIDFSDIDVVGKKISRVQVKYEYKFPYTTDGLRPIIFDKLGMQGINFREYDNSLCTYCASVMTLIVNSIVFAWNGDPWDDVEVLLGKRMDPTPGKKKTILFGQCMYNKHGNNPDINEMIPIKGCPAKLENVVNAFHEAGINVNPEIFENVDKLSTLLGIGYKHRFNEFEQSFFIEDAMSETVPPLDDVVVSQAYFDNYDDNNVPNKQVKLETRFFGLAGEKNTNAIKKILVEGPGNYEFKFKNQPFDFENGNGYVVDNYNRGLIRFLAFDRDGFLNDGKYTFTAEYWNGEIRTKSRVLKTNETLLNSYLKVREKIKFSHEIKPSPKGDSRIFISTKWTTLNELGGVDAYYANHVSEGHANNVNLHDLTSYDAIFTVSFLLPSSGFNKNFSLINTPWRPLKPDAEYTWFTEIHDANSFKDLNVSIYQPIQHFKT